MIKLIQSEPVLFQATIQAGMAVIMSFGVHLSVEQIGTIMAFTAAVLAFWTRQQVTAHANNPALKEEIK